MNSPGQDVQAYSVSIGSMSSYSGNINIRIYQGICAPTFFKNVFLQITLIADDFVEPIDIALRSYRFAFSESWLQQRICNVVATFNKLLNRLWQQPVLPAKTTIQSSGNLSYW